MSRRLSFFYETRLTFDMPVQGHAFALRCLPPWFPGQDIVDRALTLDPAVPFAQQHDSFGNLLLTGRIDGPHTYFTYAVRGTARIDLAQRTPEEPLPLYRYPSPFTQPDGALRAFFETLDLPEDPREAAWELSRAVHAVMHYTPGVTGVHTTAAEAFAGRQGVCQDYAHIYLVLARLQGLPARYCSGLPLGEGASHAWCEVLLDGIWTGIDPTRSRWTDDGYIRLCVGRDFGDCPVERGVFTGLAVQTQQVYMRVSQL